MATADRAKLIAELSLDDKMSPAIQRIDRRLGAFSGAVNRNLGRAVDSAASFAARGLVGAFKGGIESLRKLELVTAQTNAVLKSTGGAAGLTAAEIVNLSEKYESLNATIDNKVIQSGENVLLTFTNIRKQAFEPALEAALNLNQAMGGGESGLQGTIVQLGKALNDPVKGITALTRVGVSFDAAQKARIADLVKSNDLLGAQQIILAEISKEFGGSFAAAGKTAAGSQAALADAVEDVQAAFATDLLPVVTNVTNKLREYLGKPSTVAFFKDLGHTISGLFTDENLDAVAGAMETAAKAVGSALTAFNALPAPIKALAVGAFAINKVTGGAIGGLASGLGKAIGLGISSIRANTVIVSGSVVGGGTGGVPTGVPTSTGSKVLSAIGKVAIIGEAIGLILAVNAVRDQIGSASTEQAKGLDATLSKDINVKTPAELQKALDGVEAGIKHLDQGALFLVAGDSKKILEDMRAKLQEQIRNLGGRDTDKLGDSLDSSTSASLALAQTMEHPGWLDALKQGWRKQGEVTRAQVKLAEADIAKGTNLQQAAEFIAHARGAGSGGPNAIRSEIAALKGALKKTYNPNDIRAISKAIRALRDKLPKVDANAKTLQRLEKIATGTGNVDKRIASLTKALRHIESPGLRKKVQDMISEIKKEPPKADHRAARQGDKTDRTNTKVDAARLAINSTRDAARRAGVQAATAEDRAAAAIVAAIYAAVPNINLFVTASDVTQSITHKNRNSPSSSAHGGGGGNQGGNRIG